MDFSYSVSLFYSPSPRCPTIDAYIPWGPTRYRTTTGQRLSPASHSGAQTLPSTQPSPGPVLPWGQGVRVWSVLPAWTQGTSCAQTRGGEAGETGNKCSLCCVLLSCAAAWSVAFPKCSWTWSTCKTTVFTVASAAPLCLWPNFLTKRTKDDVCVHLFLSRKSLIRCR